MTSAFIPGAAAWRFYEDGTESGSTAIALEDTDLTARDVNSDSQVHLRYRLDEVGSGNVDGATTDDYQLQVDKNGGGFVNVTTTSEDVQVDTGSTLSDGSATTDRATEGISAGIGAFAAGEQEDGDGEVTDFQLPGNQHSESVWAILLISADLNDGDDLDFRLTLNGGDAGMTNSVTPRITVSKGAVYDPAELQWYVPLAEPVLPKPPLNVGVSFVIDPTGLGETVLITRLGSCSSAAATTLAHTVEPGSNRMLVAGFAHESSPLRTVDSVDYGGQAMVLAIQIGTADSGTAAGCSIWYLLETAIAAAGTNIITPTYSGARDEEAIHACAYAGVNQAGGSTTNPATASAETNEATPNPLIGDLSEVDNGLVVAFFISAIPSTTTWGSDMTEQTEQPAASSNSSMADRLSITNSNVDIEPTATDQNRAALVSALFAPPSAGGGDGTDMPWPSFPVPPVTPIPVIGY